MTTIVFLNIKGGVAKTTSALAFAELLSKKEKRVLLIDCDKQSNATLSLLKNRPGDEMITTSDLLLKKNINAAEAVVKTDYGVDIIPSNFSLLDANLSVLFEPTSRELRFAKHFETLRDYYDYCIIDCPPDINVGVTNALYAADHVLIPIRADRYGFDGLEYTFSAIEEARESNPNLRLIGCFLTMLVPGTNLSSEVKNILESLGEEVAFKTSIRQSTKVGESTFGEPLISYAPNSTVAEDYRSLLEEYLERTAV